MIGEAIYTILTAETAETTAIVDNEIVPGAISQGQDVPCVIYRFSARRTETLTGAGGLVSKHLTLECWANTYAAADALADAVITDLDLVAPGTYASTVIHAVASEDETDDYEPPIDATDRGLHMKAVGFRVWYVEE